MSHFKHVKNNLFRIFGYGMGNLLIATLWATIILVAFYGLIYITR